MPVAVIGMHDSDGLTTCVARTCCGTMIWWQSMSRTDLSQGKKFNMFSSCVGNTTMCAGR